MNIQDIAYKISVPSSLSSKDIPVFKELSEKYPYAQLFSILYLKSLANEKDVFLQEELQKHAYKITDRVKLYDFLSNSKENIKETSTIEDKKELEKDTIETITLKEETSIIEASTIENKKERELETIEKIDEKTTLKENNIVLHVDEDSKESNTTEDQKESEKTIEEKSINSNFKNDLDIEILSNAISSVFEVELENEKEEKINIDEPKTFTSWLKIANTSPSSEKEKLINKFIESESSQPKIKKEFYSPLKQAKKSIDSSEMIYSETLASILELQGNYPKAILAYEQLILTIPEKKIYFAQKINELKQKLNP